MKAKQAYPSRLDSMLRTIAGHRHGLRSFIRSLRNAVNDDAPIDHYFDPSCLRPTLTFDISKTRAFIESLRNPTQQIKWQRQKMVISTDFIPQGKAEVASPHHVFIEIGYQSFWGLELELEQLVTMVEVNNLITIKSDKVPIRFIIVCRVLILVLLSMSSLSLIPPSFSPTSPYYLL